MIKSNIKLELSCDQQKLWEIITNNENSTWRSDCSKIEVIDENHFIEYAKNNYPTFFTITQKEYFKVYKFEIQNSNMHGYWTGLFKKLENNQVQLDFIEEIELTSKVPKLFVKIYLHSQQKRYIKDLKKELERR